jgi:hypothetical protein
MFKFMRRHLAAVRLVAAIAFACAFAIAGTASAAGYVGSELGDVKPEARVVIASPQPVQLLYQFATKGAPNKAATKFTKDAAVAAVKASGLFSEVSEAPTPNGAILSVTVDNVPPDGSLTNAAAKGAVTGATMFIVGSNTRDYYKATVEYVSGPNAAKVTRTANHSIVTQIGLVNSEPSDAVKVEGGMKGSVMTMVRQIVSNPLNALASDPGFVPAPAPAAAPATPAPAEPAAPATPVAQ